MKQKALNPFFFTYSLHLSNSLLLSLFFNQNPKDMSYTHFGKPADVWKHIALCEVMTEEKPLVYVETNSAYATYILNKTPEQQYGIYHFIEKATNHPQLINSVYYKTENQAVSESKYLGSPGLAINVLKDITAKFLFFDIEKEALHSINEYAKACHLAEKIKTVNQDSIVGVTDLLTTLPKSTLIHIDPYCIDQPGANGANYLDVFIKASNLGFKCVLWYGFNTIKEKRQLNDFIKKNLKDSQTENLYCIELIMEIIEEQSTRCNPGILGNGLLTCNLSANSLSAISTYSFLLPDIYKGTKYLGFKGDLYREEIIK